MPLFKVWSEHKLNKKFVAAEIFAELVSKGIKAILFIFIYFMSAWHDRMLHARSDVADLKLLFLLAIVFVNIYYSLDEVFFISQGML